MERTSGDIVGPAALERHVIAYDIGYLGCVKDLVYCLLGYHEAISQRNLILTSRTSIS